ncbi:MAG: hypothetical protein ACJ74O_18025 [Frankiaceae bacterium]
MTRVVVVSGNPALSMGLISAGYDVADMRLSDTEAWMGAVVTAPVLVLDVDDPVLALDSVERARRAQADVEIVLVSSDRPGWPSIEAAGLQRLHVVPLPMTLPGLVRVVARACVPEQRAPDPPEPAAFDPPAATAPPPAAVAPPAPPATEAPREPAPDRPDLPAAPERHDVTAPAAKRFSRLRGGGRGRPPAPSDPAVEPAPLMHAVRRVRDGAGSLPTIGALADALADRVVTLVGASAAAVLVPDGEAWRVVGGRALRPLETRLVLHDDAWLVQHVAVNGHGLLVEDTDVVRQPLAGAPLAHRRHLLAAPLPAVGGIVVAARDDAPFAEADLRAAVTEVDRHARALRDACEVRALARALADHLDDGYG